MFVLRDEAVGAEQWGMSQFEAKVPQTRFLWAKLFEKAPKTISNRLKTSDRFGQRCLRQFAATVLQDEAVSGPRACFATYVSMRQARAGLATSEK